MQSNKNNILLANALAFELTTSGHDFIVFSALHCK